MEVLDEAIRQAAAQAVVTSPDCKAAGGARQVRWGGQLDLQPITAAGPAEGELTDRKVAGYVAKYATKAAENTGTLDRPVACWHCKGSGYDPDEAGPCRGCHGKGTKLDDVHHLVANPHAQAMISTCWNLCGLPQLEGLRLRPWAHMLGFRGHFSTNSRRYSTTLGCLRRARHDWRMRRIEKAFGLHECEDEPADGEESILVIGQWQYYGRGHSPGEAIYARTIA